MCFLVGSLPNGLAFRHELADRRSTIGRLGISTILLEEPSVSALHAELIPVGDRRYLLRDLRSRNGTLVNGQRVIEAEIKAPCRLVFGALSCELQSCDDPNCLAHRKPHPSAAGSLLLGSLPKLPSGLRSSPPTDVRHRKSRSHSRKRRSTVSFIPALLLAAPEPGVFHRDTGAGDFAAPNDHSADRGRLLSSKAWALVASAALFCTVALSYTGIRSFSRPSQAAAEERTAALSTPAPLIAAPAPLVASIAEPDVLPEMETTAADANQKAPSPATSTSKWAILPSEGTPLGTPPTPASAFAAFEDPVQVAISSPVGVAPEPPPVISSGDEGESFNPESNPSSAAASISSKPVPAPEAPAAATADTQSGNVVASETSVAPVDNLSGEESEEAIVAQEARLLASVSRPTSPETLTLEAASTIAEGENSLGEEADAIAPVDFSMPMIRPPSRRPWEFTAAPEKDLVMNDFSRHMMPWAFDAGTPSVAETELGSLPRGRVARKTPAAPEPMEPSAAPQPPVSVMILGDSLALCGFGSRLDRLFRESANVRDTNTYMACGTVPMSWLKEGLYSSVKTHCGFWTIEAPVSGGKKPLNFQDTYGMGKGKPKAYPVPKVEDLFARARPDVLVLQTGTNLFSLFRDGKTVQPAQHASMLKSQIQPFLARILKLPNPPRAIYWVASPTSGRVSNEVQDFVVKQVTELVGPMARVIDSRSLVSFPYKHMEPDKEHFIGADMDQWADRVFEMVQRDLKARPLPVALARPPGLPGDKPEPVVAKASHKPEASKAKPTEFGALRLTAKLVGKSKPLRLDQLRPYGESLVSYLYEVQNVKQGEYRDAKIVVLHPAHIAQKAQSLDRLRLGRTYELRVHELAGSPWETMKVGDDFGLIDLQSYIQLEDEARLPSAAR